MHSTFVICFPFFFICKFKKIERRQQEKNGREIIHSIRWPIAKSSHTVCQRKTVAFYKSEPAYRSETENKINTRNETKTTKNDENMRESNSMRK